MAWQREQPLEALEFRDLRERQDAEARVQPVAAPQRAAREPGLEMVLRLGQTQAELEQRMEQPLLARWAAREEPAGEQGQPARQTKLRAQEPEARQEARVGRRAQPVPRA